ncbi:hypothetical protein [Burkholderia pseudomallei]|uniref:hypothetical protein n=1 Tax=Burkholderia pseudomallei TaxID=28450 RepID=UPI00097563B2|nr:hypothetical protein [Burkholderia pseudomallei]MWA22855.1 hypothetical protein [Burkholderia pseudomallei]MWA29114.1 hypothetical protein [Burkholderia pseudomallei]
MVLLKKVRIRSVRIDERPEGRQVPPAFGDAGARPASQQTLEAFLLESCALGDACDASGCAARRGGGADARRAGLTNRTRCRKLAHMNSLGFRIAHIIRTIHRMVG